MFYLIEPANRLANANDIIGFDSELEIAGRFEDQDNGRAEIELAHHFAFTVKILKINF